MGRKRRSKSLAGQRIPIEMKLLAVKLQELAKSTGKKLSTVDAYRKIVRDFNGRL